MAKKIDRAEPKKECPSCGLGVSLEANICEFCGWDFEEEDEWILQIEKLERELMLEKQKFEPGTVNHMIESTLRNPVLDRVETAQSVGHSDEEPATAGDLLAGGIGGSPKPSKKVTDEPSVAEPRFETPREESRPTPSVAPTKTRKVRSVKTPAPAQDIKDESVEIDEPIPEFVPVSENPAPQKPVRRVRTVTSNPPAQPDEAPKKTRAIRRVKG